MHLCQMFGARGNLGLIFSRDVSIPSGVIIVVRLIPPGSPSASRASCKQFKIRSGATLFDNPVLLVRFPRVLAFTCCQACLYLPPPRREGARVLAAYT